MIFEIKHKITGEILFSTKESCIRIAVEMAIKAGVSLQNANLQNADLQNADLQNANLQNADLQNANLQNADLQNADLDFSCFPLWCGSFDMKVDIKLVYQLCYHICKLENSSIEYANIKTKLTKYAN